MRSNAIPRTSRYDEVQPSYGHLYISTTVYVKKEDGGIVLLLFQSEAGSSGLDERDKVRDHLNQNLTASKMVFR